MTRAISRRALSSPPILEGMCLTPVFTEATDRLLRLLMFRYKAEHGPARVRDPPEEPLDLEAQDKRGPEVLYECEVEHRAVKEDDLPEQFGQNFQEPERAAITCMTSTRSPTALLVPIPADAALAVQAILKE